MFDEVNDDNQQLIMALGPKKQYRERRVYRNPSEFFQRFRMSERMVEKLLQIIGPTIKPIVPSNNALSAEQKVLLYLRFVSTNETGSELQDTQGFYTLIYII